MEVNAKGQIIANNGLQWHRYPGENLYWTAGISFGSGLRIELEWESSKRWHLYRVGYPALQFYGSLKDCMRVAEIYMALRGG